MMEDIYDRYKRMSFAELRKYLKDQRTLQKLFFLIPAVVSVIAIINYCMGGWSTYPSMIDEMSNNKEIHARLGTFGIIDWIVCLGMIPLLPYEKTHLKFDFASSIIYGTYNAVKLLFDIVDPFCWGMVFYFLIAALLMRPICKRIVFLKSLPDYPFLPSVELERQRDIEMMKYSENSQKNRQLIKEAEKKVAGTLEEKMEQLPKRHIDKYRISRGDFDDTEGDYTDKLIGSDYKNGENIVPEFDDPSAEYTEDFITAEAKLTMDRRERIDEIDGGFEGDYDAKHTDRFAPDMIDEASKRFKLTEKKPEPGVNKTDEDMTAEEDYMGDLPKFVPQTYAEFDEEEKGYTDELYGSFKDQGVINDEKPEGYKPVI